MKTLVSSRGGISLKKLGTTRMYASYLTDRYLKAIIHEIICYKNVSSIFVKITNKLAFYKVLRDEGSSLRSCGLFDKWVFSFFRKHLKPDTKNLFVQLSLLPRCNVFLFKVCGALSSFKPPPHQWNWLTAAGICPIRGC